MATPIQVSAIIRSSSIAHYRDAVHPQAMFVVVLAVLLVTPSIARSAPADGGNTGVADAGAPETGTKPTLEMPRRRKQTVPPSPGAWKNRGIEGDVSVMITIDTTGYVNSVKVIKESSFPELNEQARKQAAAERFEPAKSDGKPIPYALSFTYHFRVEKQ